MKYFLGKSKKRLDLSTVCEYNIGCYLFENCVQTRVKEVYEYENDIPAKKEVQGKGPWFPQENEYGEWQEGACGQKGKGKT